MNKTWFYSDQQLQALKEAEASLLRIKHDMGNSGIFNGIAAGNPYKSGLNAAADGIEKAQNAILKIYFHEVELRREEDSTEEEP